jgi:hypothetical protein
MTYFPLAERSVPVDRMAEPTLADLAARYFTTPHEVYFHTPSAVAAGSFEDFVTSVEAGGSFRVPIPHEERAETWIAVALNPGERLSARCQILNADPRRAGTPPLTPTFLWNLAANAPFREAALLRSPGRLADDDPERATYDYNKAVMVPRHLGQIQSPIRALPNGAVTVDPIPDWVVELRTTLEILEAQIDRLDLLTTQVEQARTRSHAEVETMRLIKELIRITHEHPTPILPDDLTDTLQTATQLYAEAKEQMLGSGFARASHAALLGSLSSTYAAVDGMMYRQPRTVALLDRLRTLVDAADDPTHPAPAPSNAVVVGRNVLEWHRLLTARGLLALHRADGQSQVIDAIAGAAPGDLGGLAASYPESPALWAVSAVTSVGLMIFGNAPGPSNLYLSTLQVQVYRKLASATIRGARDATLVQRTLQALGERYGVAAAEIATAEREVATGTRANIVGAARRLTGNVQAGPLASVALLILVGVGLYATVASWPAGQVPTPDQLTGLLGSGYGGLAVALQAWMSLQGSSAALVEIGNAAGVIAGVVGIVANAFALVDYLVTTRSQDLNWWKIGSLSLGILGGALTLAGFLELWPLVQLAGVVVSLAAIVTAIIADPEAVREWWDGPVKTLLLRLMPRIFQGEQFRLTVVANQAMNLEALAIGLLVKINAHSFELATLHDDSEPATAEAERTAAVDQLVRLGILRPQALQMIFVRHHPQNPRHLG